MNMKKMVVIAGKYLFLALFLCLLVAVLCAAEMLRRS
jgi:hypothetical protein